MLSAKKRTTFSPLCTQQMKAQKAHTEKLAHTQGHTQTQTHRTVLHGDIHTDIHTDIHSISQSFSHANSHAHTHALSHDDHSSIEPFPSHLIDTHHTHTHTDVGRGLKSMYDAVAGLNDVRAHNNNGHDGDDNNGEEVVVKEKEQKVSRCPMHLG